MNKPKLIIFTLTLLAAVAVVRADEVTVAGNTNGSSFDSNNSATLNGLTFNSQMFMQTTSGGTAGPFQIGSFTLLTTNAVFANEGFTLQVTFTAPPGINGGPSTTFMASVNGVVSNSGGGVGINFDNTPQVFTFSFMNGGQTTTGSFGFQVLDTGVGNGQTTSLLANIVGASQVTVPDGGSTVALLGLALVGVGALRRKFALG